MNFIFLPEIYDSVNTEQQPENTKYAVDIFVLEISSTWG